MRSAAPAIMLSILAAAGLLAQDRPARFQSGVDLISVTATVVDSQGRLVRGLPVEAFEIFEEGERQQITQFTSERVPVSLAVLLDVSDSMFGERLVDARAAVERFLFDLLDLQPGQRVLDIFCGYGRHALELARLGCTVRTRRAFTSMPSRYVSMPARGTASSSVCGQDFPRRIFRTGTASSMDPTFLSTKHWAARRRVRVLLQPRKNLPTQFDNDPCAQGRGIQDIPES